MLVKGVTIGPLGQYAWVDVREEVNNLPVGTRVRTIPEDRARPAFYTWVKTEQGWSCPAGGMYASGAPFWESVMVEYVP